MLIEVILFLTLFLIVYYFFGRLKLAKNNIPPGPLRLPVIGSLLQIVFTKQKTPFGIFHELSKKYGPIVFLQVGTISKVILEDYELIKEVLCDEIWVDRYYSKYIANRSFGKSLGILLIGGNCWKEMRKFSVRTLRDFGFGKQKSMGMSLQDELTYLTMNLENQINLGKGQTIISMKQFFTISVLNILWTLITGLRFSHDDTKLQKLLEINKKKVKRNAIGSLTSPLYLYTAFPFLFYILPYFTSYEQNRIHDQNMVHKFFRDILEERRAEGHYREEQRDYIDVFLREIDAHKNDPPETNFYTDEQFIVVTMDLFMSGSETTSNTIEFAFLYLMKYSQVQKKIQEEIDTIVGHNRLPCISDKSSMPYTEATILEVQRHANVIPISIRSPTKDTTLGGYKIPAGTGAFINLHSMHMDEKIWEDPLNFLPERFLNSHKQIINADKILPFGIGKRVCIGEQLATASLFTYICTILQKFTFEESSLQTLPTTDPVLGFTLAPQPYHAIIKQRPYSHRVRGVTSSELLSPGLVRNLNKKL